MNDVITREDWETLPQADREAYRHKFTRCYHYVRRGLRWIDPIQHIESKYHWIASQPLMMAVFNAPAEGMGVQIKEGWE